MNYYESPGMTSAGRETYSEFVMQVEYSLVTVKVEEMWVRQFQQHAEKLKPQQLKWAWRDATNEQILVNMGMVSESTDVMPSGDTI